MQVASRFLLFAAIPLVVIFGGQWLYWPTLYFAVPVFIPAAPYVNIEVLWAVPFLSIPLVAFVAAWVGRNMEWKRSIMVFAATCIVVSVATHVAFNVLGYTYTMETP